MVGLKHRYLIVQIKSETGRSFAPTIKTILLNSIKDDFGDYIMSKVDYFEICEYHEALGIVIIRCNLDIYKYLCYAIVTKGQIGKLPTSLRILYTSGILKKAKAKFLQQIGKEINANALAPPC